jgi:hypothetical protein
VSGHMGENLVSFSSSLGNTHHMSTLSLVSSLRVTLPMPTILLPNVSLSFTSKYTHPLPSSGSRQRDIYEYKVRTSDAFLTVIYTYCSTSLTVAVNVSFHTGVFPASDST